MNIIQINNSPLSKPFLSFGWSLPYATRKRMLAPVFLFGLPKTFLIREDKYGYSCNMFIKYKCIFVHVPKCAGISVTKSLFGNLGGGHLSLADYQLLFDLKDFSTFFKFTFVRNPWDRLVSAFCFLKNGGFDKADARWAKNNLSRYDDFNTFVREWVNGENIYKKNHFFPQFSFIYDPDRQTRIDYIGKVENLTQDFTYVKNKLGISAELALLNQTGRKDRDYRKYYTTESIEIVANTYAEDIKLFSYKFE